MKLYYDFHLHSCLSPCGDNEMTPYNLVNMAKVLGFNIIALTDHNSTKNCRAFFAAAKRHGIVPIAGMELTTAEDVHIVCLFPSLEAAEEFDDEYRSFRILYKNRKDIFGDQLILDEEDNVIGEEEHLLLNASTLPIEEAGRLAEKYGAAVFPAHIDRDENGIIAALGCVPETPRFHAVEFRDGENIGAYSEKYGLSDKLILTDSDAHYLWDISEAENYIELEDEPYSSDLVRRKLIEALSGK